MHTNDVIYGLQNDHDDKICFGIGRFMALSLLEEQPIGLSLGRLLHVFKGKEETIVV